MGEFWEDIKRTCAIDVYKIFDKLNNKFIYTDCPSFADINIFEIKPG